MSTPKPLAERLAARFNELYEVGTPVRYWLGVREGKGIESVTRSIAWDVCGSAVVSVKGHAGGIALTHIEVLP